jgi:hypothetical protein
LIFEWTLIIAESVKKGPKEKNSETVTDRHRFICATDSRSRRDTGEIQEDSGWMDTDP